jgi:hypothetical protein
MSSAGCEAKDFLTDYMGTMPPITWHECVPPPRLFQILTTMLSVVRGDFTCPNRFIELYLHNCWRSSYLLQQFSSWQRNLKIFFWTYYMWKPFSSGTHYRCRHSYKAVLRLVTTQFTVRIRESSSVVSLWLRTSRCICPAREPRTFHERSEKRVCIHGNKETLESKNST